MRLLVVTQAVDSEDPVLGFFVRWIEELAKHVEAVEVICLRKGVYCLPDNVRVHSLGKERGTASRAAYVWRFLTLVWRLRHAYGAVFVHMNQEYVLSAGWLWKLLGKRIYLWRNHYAGSWLTDSAAVFCTKIFFTSRYSYTMKYAQAVRMPVGVDTERFYKDDRAGRAPHSILFLARLSPSKRPDMLVDALIELVRTGVSFTATFVGSPGESDSGYDQLLQKKIQEHLLFDRVTFLPAVPNRQTPGLYRTHEIFVNTSPSGMLDKTLFEAAACGCRVLASSADIAERLGQSAIFTTSAELAERLAEALVDPAKPPLLPVEGDTLPVLAEKLMGVILEGS
jgi:glycosyltransferase involved in cell wall biosynthesis